MLYQYKNIVIKVISQDGRYTSAVPVSNEAIDMFTLEDGVMYLPNETLKIFTNDIR